MCVGCSESGVYLYHCCRTDSGESMTLFPYFVQSGLVSDLDFTLHGAHNPRKSVGVTNELLNQSPHCSSTTPLELHRHQAEHPTRFLANNVDSVLFHNRWLVGVAVVRMCKCQTAARWEKGFRRVLFHCVDNQCDATSFRTTFFILVLNNCICYAC